MHSLSNPYSILNSNIFIVQAEVSVQEDMVQTAREHCDTFRNCLAGGIAWVALFILVVIIIITVMTITHVSAT